VFIMGVLADKDHATMTRLAAPLARAIVTVTPPNTRALSAEDLAAELTEQGAMQVQAVESMTEAVQLARDLAGENRPIIAFGSLYSIRAIVDALA